MRGSGLEMAIDGKNRKKFPFPDAKRDQTNRSNREMLYIHRESPIFLLLTRNFLLVFFFFFFCTRPPPGLLSVLGPLGSFTDTTHQPSPALRLLGCWWLLMDKTDLQALSPSGTYSHKTGTSPPSCANFDNQLYMLTLESRLIGQESKQGVTILLYIS